MTVYVALLRGVNVGGHHQLPMADLRAAVAQAGAEDVSTYIQSGNVVFRHGAKAPRLTRELQEAIAATAGFDVPVTLRTAKELRAVVEATPFPVSEPTRLHVSFLDETPPAGAFDSVDRAAFAPEDFSVVGREVYLHLPSGIGRTKLVQALGLYTRHPATTRNWRTVVTLRDRSAEL
jgi:uncharacterized protein (DUF1697 family)